MAFSCTLAICLNKVNTHAYVTMDSSSTDMEPLWAFWGDLVDNQGATNGQDYSALTVRELRLLLKERGLPVSGKKSKLITRLENDALQK